MTGVWQPPPRQVSSKLAIPKEANLGVAGPQELRKPTHFSLNFCCY